MKIIRPRMGKSKKNGGWIIVESSSERTIISLHFYLISTLPARDDGRERRTRFVAGEKMAVNYCMQIRPKK